MTTPDLDRLITHVAGELTRANADGLGARVRGRLRARASASLRPRASARQALQGWLRWAIGSAGVAAVIVFVVIGSRTAWRDNSESLRAVPAHSSAAAPEISRSNLSAVALAKAEDRPLQDTAPHRTARSARRAAPALTPAEIEWLARALPPLPEAAAVAFSEVAVKNIEPRELELPVLVIEPLGSRDINR